MACVDLGKKRKKILSILRGHLVWERNGKATRPTQCLSWPHDSILQRWPRSSAPREAGRWASIPCDGGRSRTSARGGSIGALCARTVCVLGRGRWAPGLTSCWPLLGSHASLYTCLTRPHATWSFCVCNIICFYFCNPFIVCTTAVRLLPESITG